MPTGPSLSGLVAAALVGVAAAVSSVLALREDLPPQGVLEMLVLFGQVWFAVKAALCRSVPMLSGVTLLALISVNGPVDSVVPLMLLAALAAGGAATLEWRRTRAGAPE